MITSIKKNLKSFYKNFVIFIFSQIYKKPRLIKRSKKDQSIEEYEIILDKNKYKIFRLVNGRIFTDTNDTTAYISKYGNLSIASMQYKKFDKINSFNKTLSKNETLTRGTPKFKKKFKGNILSLVSGGAAKNNFTHWFTDVVPRLKIFNKKFHIKIIDKFYVPSLKYNYQYDSLKLLGIKKSQIITSEDFKHIEAENIFATSHPCDHHPMKVKKWSLNFIRNLYLKKSKNHKYVKIFIDRNQINLVNFKNLIKYKNLRILINEIEIKQYLKSRGFKIIKPENFTFSKQVQIFSNANLVVGMYGAAMMMLSFCKKKTKVLEIKPIKGGNEFKNISRLIGLKHKQINLKPIYKSSIPQNGLMKCPLKKIKQSLNYY